MSKNLNQAVQTDPPTVCFKSHRLFVIPSLILIIPLLILGISRVLIPHDMDQSFHAWPVNDLLLSGLNPWSLKQVNEPPYCISAYGPMYYFISAAAQGLFGAQYWVTRLISLLCNIVICIVIWQIASAGVVAADQSGSTKKIRFSSFYFGSWIASMAMAGSSTFIANMSVGRSDNIGLAASLTGMMLLIHAVSQNKTNIKTVMLSGILIGLAPLMKQYFISAILVGLFVSYRRGVWKQFAATAIGLPFLLVLGLVITSQGGFLEICLRYPTLPEKSLSNSIEVFIDTLFKRPSNTMIVLGLILSAFCALPQIRKNKDTTNSTFVITALSLWLVLSGMIAIYTARRILGGSVLYWYEFLAVACIMMGRLINIVIANNSFRPAQFRAWMVWLGLMLLITSVFNLRSLRGTYFEWEARPYYLELQQIIESETPRNEPTLSYFSEVPRRAGRPVLFNDLLLYNRTTDENRKLLHGKIKEKVFSCLLLQPQNADEYLTSDYVEVKTEVPFPTKIFAVKLYLRSDLVKP